MQKLITMVIELAREVKDLCEEFSAFSQSFSPEPLGVGILPVALWHNMEELDCAEATLQSPEAKKTMVIT